MTGQRSYEDFEVGQQLYAALEAIKKPEVLWAKLSTGHYDWLGVRRNGRYVVGRPRLTPNRRRNDGALPDEQQHRNRVEYLGPLDRTPHWEAYPTAEDARAAYDRIVTGDPVSPIQYSGVCRVRLVVDGQSAEQVLVVRTLPRMV